MPDAPDVVAALQAANARLRAENAELKAENAELKAQLAERAEKIVRLERLISRNSGNSSMPPGTDDLPGKKPPPPSRTGAAGASRASSRTRRARTWPGGSARIRPGTCSRRAPARAGRTSPGLRPGGGYSHQVTDLPETRVEPSSKILDGRHRDVRAGIRRRATANGYSPAERAGADKCAAYLQNKQDYLDYPAFLAVGWPVASGLIEGAARWLRVN